MLGHGQQLDVRKAETLHMVGQRLGDVAVAEALPRRLLPPRAEVDFVDRDRFLKQPRPLARCHPVGVLPFIIQVFDDRGKAGHRAAVLDGRLEVEGVGIGFIGLEEAAPEAVFIRLAGPYAAHVDLPEAGFGAFHRAGFGIPVVEVADHRDGLGMGRPDGEPGALPVRVGAELFVALKMRALVPEIEVVFVEPGHSRAGRWRVGCGPFFGYWNMGNEWLLGTYRITIFRFPIPNGQTYDIRGGRFEPQR